MDHLPDENLLMRFRETGDMRYFDALVARHLGKVRALVYPMVLNDADADDVTQDVFLRVARGLDGFRQSARFSTWLYRITMNTCRTFLRKKIRNPVHSCATLPEPTARDPRPDSGLHAEETGDRIEQAIGALSPKLRAAITLTAIQGLSVRDAARIENCLTATLYWRVHEARRRLKAALAEE